MLSWLKFKKIARVSPRHVSPHTRRVTCSSQRPCLVGADRCLQSDGMTNSRLQAKPAWFVVDYPVPYAYSQRFLNMTGGTPPAVWTNEQRQFASAVWAQDSMIGAVLLTWA